MSANILHPTLQRAQVETSFDDGRPGDAVRDAFREVERLVRELAGGGDDSVVELMQTAFAPTIGRLSDAAASLRAQCATQRMFVSSFMKYRPDGENAAAPDDQLQAVEGVLLADLLARELARIAQRLGGGVIDVP